MIGEEPLHVLYGVVPVRGCDRRQLAAGDRRFDLRCGVGDFVPAGAGENDPGRAERVGHESDARHRRHELARAGLRVALPRG
jgi:hypothetical protein